MREIVLGTSSRARIALMETLQLPFVSVAPVVDETPLADETVPATVTRLATAKAIAVAQSFPEALVIGCDQLGVVDQQVLMKPKDHADAVRQLMLQSNRKINFYTGITLYDAKTEVMQTAVETYDVFFRTLTTQEIEDYLQKEKPYACAGSLRAEGLGIALIDKFAGNDYTALIGLPLIRLSHMLRKSGVNLFA